MDVPDSSMCIIDKADHFGMSQVHQIRGRIGRGKKPPAEILQECFCVLLFDDDSAEQVDSKGDPGSLVLPTPRQIPLKLEILSKTYDGFEIAEKDLELRGPGSFFGAQQSGQKFSGLRAGNFMIHGDLLKDAHSVASSIYNNKYHVNVNDQEIQNLLTIFPSPTASVSGQSISKTIKSKTVKSEITENFVDLTVLEGPESPAIILFDLETTGLDPSISNIIQFAAKLLDDNKKCEIFNAYINPKVSIPEFITDLTGITKEKLEKDGKPFGIAWKEFSKWLKEVSKSDIEGRNRPIVLIAHNLLIFDLPFLDLEIRRQDTLRGDYWIEENGITSFVDSLALLRLGDVWTDRKTLLNLPKTSPTQPEKFKLGLIYEFIFKKQMKNAHDATGDIHALGEILESEGIKNNWKKYANKIQTRTFKKR